MSPRTGMSRGVLAFALSSALSISALAPLSAMAQEPAAESPSRSAAKAAPAAASGRAATVDGGQMLGRTAAADLPPAATAATSPFAQQLAGTYVDPDRIYSTDVRWWLGEASATDESLLEEVQALYDGGFRGVELCMQSDPGAPDADYAYGSEMWTHKWNLVMNKLLDLGMSVYLTSGTNWATSNVPGLDPASQAAMQNLTLGSGTVAAGQSISSLVAPASASRREGARFVTAYAYRVTAGDTVDPASFVDLKPLVTQGADAWTQNLSWTAPNDGTYRVFGLWTQGTYQTSAPSTLPSYATNYFDTRGVEALRAFWEEHYLADPALKAKIAAGDVQLFMDSPEMTFGNGFTWWTEDMVAEFRKRKGYDITPYLFLISGVEASVATPYHSVGTTGTYRLAGEERRRQGIVNDYQDVLTQLYRERMLQPLKKWLNSVGIKTRAQISYGKPLEISEPAMDVDFPEAENLNQNNNVDIFRLWTGAAKLENKVLSSETSAQRLAWNFTRQKHLRDAYSLYAAGFQRIIWHVWATGYGYGNYQWPGYQPGTFSANWFHNWGTRNPGSQDYDELNAHLGRVQRLMQTGQSRTDVGFIHQNWTQGVRSGGGIGSDNAAMNWQLAHQGVYYRSTELQDNGYTYDYFSPRFLFDEDVRFDEKTKTIEKAGYQAIVLYQKWLDLEGAKRILGWAKKGLKVVVLEDAASRTPGNDGKDAALKKVTDELKTLPTVRQATVYDDIDYFSATPGGYDDNVLEKLRELGVEPYTGYPEPNLQLLNQTREDAEGNRYVYLYNYGDDEYHPFSNRPEIRNVKFGKNIKTDVEVEGRFVPYRIDAWSGAVTELADYRWEDGKTVVPVDLDQNNVDLLAFEKVDAERLHVVDTDAASAYTTADGVAVRATESGTVSTELSNGRTYADDVKVPASYDITDWDLTVQSWRPSATAGDLTRTETIDGLTTVNRKTSTVRTPIEVELDTMTTWDKIPEVGKAVSGEGHYEASFDWDADSATGAYLDLGDTLQESMAVWINGTKVGGQASSNPTKATKDVGGVGKPTIDDGTGNQVPLVGQGIDSGGISWTKPLADVSGHLVDGTNTIVIEYNSALSNVQLDRGINVETQNVNNWWKNNFEYLSFGPERAKLVPFVDVEYSAKAATRVSAAPVRSTYGKASTIVVRVAGDNPTGTVTLRNGASAVGSAPVVNGTASIRLARTALPAGSRSLQAVYAGDGANRSSTGPVAVTVAKARTRLTVKVAPSKVKPGRHAKLAVRVAAPGLRAAGVVRVKQGGKVIARGSLNAAGKVTVQLPKRKRGYRVVVTYPGTANLAAASKSVTVRIKK